MKPVTGTARSNGYKSVTTIKDGVETEVVTFKRVNLSPGKTPCKMAYAGCNGVAANGEFFCLNCRKRLAQDHAKTEEMAKNLGIE